MPRALLLVLATMSSADFCLIIQTITDVDAVVFRHFFYLPLLAESGWAYF